MKRLIAAVLLVLVGVSEASAGGVVGRRWRWAYTVDAAGVVEAMVVPDGPLTSLMNLATVTDSNGYLLVTNAAATGATTPLTPMANLAGRTDANGYLMVALGASVTPLQLPDGSAGAPSLTFASDTTKGFFSAGTNKFGLSLSGAEKFEFNTAGFHLEGAGYRLGLSSTAGAEDVLLYPGAANVLEQRNGTNAQTWNVYNTTDGTNKEYGSFAWNANVFQIGASKAGTGSQRLLALAVNGTNKFALDTSGNFVGVSAGGGLGYAAGAGGAVSQATSRTTGVTLNTVSGDITLFSAAGSATAASFTVTNSAVALNDNVIINQKSGTNLYNVIVTTVSAGSFVVTFYTTGGTATDAPVFHFGVVKGAIS